MSIERIPCNPILPCALVATNRQCFEDVHHLYFPKSAYKTGVEKSFTELEENKVIMCRQMHNQIHQLPVVPEKPPIGIMWLKVHAAKRREV